MSVCVEVGCKGKVFIYSVCVMCVLKQAFFIIIFIFALELASSSFFSAQLTVQGYKKKL